MNCWWNLPQTNSIEIPNNSKAIGKYLDLLSYLLRPETLLLHNVFISGHFGQSTQRGNLHVWSYLM